MKHRIITYILTAVLIATVLLASSSCSYSMKEFTREHTYADPQTLGGKWDVFFDEGTVYHDAVCSYWGTTDDTSVWTLPDGSILIQSGTCHAVRSV